VLDESRVANVLPLLAEQSKGAFRSAVRAQQKRERETAAEAKRLAEEAAQRQAEEERAAEIAAIIERKKIEARREEWRRFEEEAAAEVDATTKVRPEASVDGSKEPATTE
jgi:hypothetical protein